MYPGYAKVIHSQVPVSRQTENAKRVSHIDVTNHVFIQCIASYLSDLHVYIGKKNKLAKVIGILNIIQRAVLISFFFVIIISPTIKKTTLLTKGCQQLTSSSHVKL